MTAIELWALNELPEAAFVTALSGVFEHAEWVAAGAAGSRPFATVQALHEGLMREVRTAPEHVQRAFLSGHPELGVDKLDLTPESRAEQASLGLDERNATAELAALNRRYRERFGIPFIVCVRRHTPANILRVLHRRLGSDPASELAAALAEVGFITRLRLADRVRGPGMPAVGGHFSTHVLDTAGGRPAVGLGLVLLGEGHVLADATTNEDGRAPAPLLPDGPLRMGRYEMQFDAGRYFAERGVDSFYDIVPVRFVIGAAEGHYHIPLLLSPFGYTTYRGS